ncbi:hypothetical protein GCM10027451_29200 [Geodermatophilus aquaeductus]
MAARHADIRLKRDEATADEQGMTRFAHVVSVPLAALVVLLAGCGASEADLKACDGVAALDLSSRMGGRSGQQEVASRILGQLSGYAPGDDRLIRAVNQAREDALAVASATHPVEIGAAFTALEGSLSAVQTVCDDLKP